MFKYLNLVIHSLLTIPRTAAQLAATSLDKKMLESINLVTFKVGDMMRCKCSCLEQEFVKILKSVESIHHLWPDVMKISRVKNRLSTEANDILINFFFGEKAEC